MQDESVDRRSFLKVMGAMGMSSTLLPETAFGLHPASASIVEQALGRRTVAFVSGIDTHRDVAMEVFTLEPGGDGAGSRDGSDADEP